MHSTSTHRQTAEGREDRRTWHICCISPDRAILQSLAPAWMACFPGAAVREIPAYPASGAIRAELGRPLPDVCFLDLLSDRGRALSLLPQIRDLDTRVNIVVLLAGEEPDLILRCLRSGANEFLLQPFGADQMQAAVAKLKAIPAAPQPQGNSTVWCVMPAKGACGASTVACHLALQGKRVGWNRTLLADMDPLTGVLSFLLKLKPVSSFIDVLQRAGSLDAGLWKAMLVNYNGVDLLPAPELLMQGISDVRDAFPLVEFARTQHDAIILDAAAAYGEWNLSMAAASDHLLLVTTTELPALHGAARSLSYLHTNGISRSKIRVIVNRVEKHAGRDADSIESLLNVPVLHTIPNDYESVQRALVAGKPVPASSALGKSFAVLADKVAGRDQPPAGRRAPFSAFLSSLFRASS